MICTIEQSTLETYLPFTRDVKGSKIFSAYAQPLADADFVLKRDVLGAALYTSLQTAFSASAMPSNTALDDNEQRIGCALDEIKTTILTYICNRAAYMSAGKNDLVQTTFGFGTVSGQQEAIASTARVEAMKSDCKERYEQAQDDLIKMLVGNSYTETLARSSYSWKNKTRFLVWTREEIAAVLPIDQSKELGSLHDELARIISREELAALVAKMRLCTVNDSESKLIDDCRNLMAAFASHDAISIETKKDVVYATLAKYTFTEWEASDEYAARKIGPYANTQESGAFFMI